MRKAKAKAKEERREEDSEEQENVISSDHRNKTRLI
jgi:hypothetical protein